MFFRKKKQEPIEIDDRLKHIAFIMDGNGRWAKKRGMPREMGHKAGAETFRKIGAYCQKIGIPYMTVYAFSTENWKRPKHEVDAIMALLDAYMDEFSAVMKKENIHLRFVGDLSVFSASVQEKMKQLDEASKEKSFTLNIAVNYGGREEICHAFRVLSAEGKTDITEEDISRVTYTTPCPDPDLIVRTGGDLRLSNFLMWQSAYSELYFTPVLWPDLSENDVDMAVREFYGRKRRYGGLS